MMDADLDFCLKRFADDQVTDSIKQVTQLENNLKRKSRNITDTIQHDDAKIRQQENTLVNQFSHDLNENNIVINKTRQIIENEFGKALNGMKLDIETIAQISTTRNNSREDNEEIRAASNKIRLQIARIDSELTHLFNMIDYNNSIDCSSRIIQWFRQHYGYVNELNRMVGKNNNSGDLLVFSQNSPLIQSVLERAHLWSNRQKLITKFTHQMNEDLITSKQLMDSLYRMTDKSSSLRLIKCYIQNRQDGRRHQEEHLLRKMKLELEQKYTEQQTQVIELVNALCQLSVDTTNEFQLNNKFKKVFFQREVSKQVVPILIDRSEEEADGDLLLIIRLEANYNKWISNENSIQQRFCLALCKSMELPTDTLTIEYVQDDGVILHIMVHSSYRQSIIKQISAHGRDNKSSMSIIQAIESCCAKFDSRVHSIVAGKYTLPIEKRLMDLQWNKMHANNGESTGTTCLIDPFDLEDKRSLCPEGWKRFGIKVADNYAIFDAKWSSWHVAYHGSQGPYAPFILTSGLRVLTQQYCIPGNQQAICLSPSIEYSAHPRHTRLWKKVMNDGEKCQYYQLVFQCRVNPAAVGNRTPETLLHGTHKTTRIDQNFHNEELEWIIHAGTATQEYIRDNIVCYGLMVRVIENEPKDLPILSWWKDSRSAEY